MSLLNNWRKEKHLNMDGRRVLTQYLMGCMQFITFGFACTPLYFVWEKVIGMHDTKSICLRALARLPVVIPIWFFAIIFPFFGPINSAVGALLVSFTVYIIPATAHMLTYRKASARQVNHSVVYTLTFHVLNWICYILCQLVYKERLSYKHFYYKTLLHKHAKASNKILPFSHFYHVIYVWSLNEKWH